MSILKVIRADGEEHEITFSTLSKWLADKTQYADVLGSVCRDGSTTARLKANDGAVHEVELRYVGPHRVRRDEADDQAHLPWNTDPRNGDPADYDAEVELTFDLPARISCLSHSPTQAARLIREVCAGRHPVPVGFEVAINGETLRGFFARIERITAMGIPLSIRDCKVGRAVPRLMLEGTRS
jgi:hypothetical protein